MAIEANTSIDGRSPPVAYIRVARVTRAEKDVICEGVVYVELKKKFPGATDV